MLKDKPKTKKVGIHDLAKRYASKTGKTVAESQRYIQLFVDVIHEALVAEEEVSFIGEFSLKVSSRAARKGVNPRTKEQVMYPAYKTITVRVGSNLKNGINSGE